MSYNAQSNQPGLTINTLASRAWLTTGNTDVVADANVRSNTIVLIMNTSAFVGPWYVTTTAGTGFTVTSTNQETQTITTYKYLLL